MEEDQGYLGDDDDFKPDPNRIYSFDVNHDNIKIGDRVKVNGGPGNSSAISEATILNSIMNGPDKRYYIHYAGSHIRFDEWVHKSYILAHRSRLQNTKEDIDKKNNTNAEEKPSFDARSHANSSMASYATSSRKRTSSSSSSSSSSNNLKKKKSRRKKLNKSPKVTDTSQDSDTDSLNSQNANINEIDKIFIQHQNFFSDSERNANYSKNILEVNNKIDAANESALKQSLLNDLNQIKTSSDEKFSMGVHTSSSSDDEIIGKNKKKLHQYKKNEGTSDLNALNNSGNKKTDNQIKHSHRSSSKWKHFPKYTPDPLCLQVDLKDEHDPDKRIKILTEKISQLRKDYMFLKEGVARIKKARKKKLKKISRKQQSLSKNE